MHAVHPHTRQLRPVRGRARRGGPLQRSVPVEARATPLQRRQVHVHSQDGKGLAARRAESAGVGLRELDRLVGLVGAPGRQPPHLR
eukprot:3838963-Lingulodinium_polyedra.AAC.1